MDRIYRIYRRRLKTIQKSINSNDIVDNQEGIKFQDLKNISL